MKHAQFSLSLQPYSSAEVENHDFKEKYIKLLVKINFFIPNKNNKL